MKRVTQAKHNKLVIEKIALMLGYSYTSCPSYKTVSRRLEKHEILSSVGNKWTERSIYRMLQRNGYSGLWELHKLKFGK